MVTQAPPRSRVAIAIAFTLSCVGLIIFVWTQFGGTVPFAPVGYRVHAVFRETGLLVPNADVRIAGVNVGKVVKVEPQGINSLVTMDIDQQYAPIPADTRAILRQKTLLGEAYITLSNGNSNGPKLADGGTIPRSQIEPTQALDQVLNSFDAQTQRNLQRVLLGIGVSLAGRGQDLNDAFGNFAPAASQLQAVVGILNQQSGNVRSLINDGGIVLNTLGSRSADLQSLVTAGDQVLSTTAQVDTALTATVDAMPAFLTGLRTTLTTLNGTLAIAKPSLDALQPVAPLLTPALQNLITLSGPLLALLHQAPPVLQTATRALPAIDTFVTAFHPALDALLPAAQNVIPIINLLSQYKQETTAAMGNLAADLLAQAPANVPGGQASYLRALTTLGADSLFGQPERAGSERTNANIQPGQLSQIASGGLHAANCANTSNTGVTIPLGNVNVPCKVQGAFNWGHGITSSFFPHTTKAPK
jgi:virulence factor Mce-like protein